MARGNPRAFYLLTEMEQLSFFNTTNLQGQELQTAIEKAETQKEKIRVFFENTPDTPMTPFQVYCKVFASNFNPPPVTSIRRAMTVLTGEGFLTKTNDQAPGEYGAPNYKWVRRP